MRAGRPPIRHNEMVSLEPSQRTLRGAIFDLGGVMTEPLGTHRASIEDPVQLDLLRFFLNESTPSIASRPARSPTTSSSTA